MTDIILSLAFSAAILAAYIAASAAAPV